ncbi:hypothetical protein D5086_012716 [Populus alba]|uniref:Uncharacterized protein n=1 Tax=Populus alba TaxID=43335 RepID=A0ACC4C2Y2_POPAL
MDKCFCVSVYVSLCLLSSIHVIFAANYVPTEKILLDCGANSDQADSDGRDWTSDRGSLFLSSSTNSSTATASTQDPSVPQVPYLTARIFRSSFTYSFPVVSGRKFIRLYFYPSSYSGLNASNALFSVTAGSYTLLSNFSVAQTAEALNYVSIMKEYLVNVDGDTLNITFSPSSNPSSAYAFVNGIEIVSMPDIYSNVDGVKIVGQDAPFTIDNTTALENVYRLNVGGNSITPSADTGLFRSWSDDQIYLYGAAFGLTQSADPNITIRYPAGMSSYVAPSDMLHFCEVSNITKVNQRVFDIFLNNQTAEDGADVIAWAGGNGNNGVPVYKDYVVLVPGGPPQQDMWLGLHPNPKSKPQYYDAILNGVEIFKLSNTNDGNLAGPNPIPAPQQKEIDPIKARPGSGSGQSKSQTAIIAGGVSGGVVLAIVIGFCVLAASRRRHRHGKEPNSSDGPSGWLPLSLYGNSHSAGSAKTNTTGSYASSLPSNLCRHFSFAEIKAATNNFDEALILGLQESAEDGAKGIVGADEEVPFNVAYKGKKDPDASPAGYDGNVTDSRSSGISMSIGGRSLASEDSDGLTPSAVFSQIMNPKGR